MKIKLKYGIIVSMRSIIFYGLNTFLPLYWIGFGGIATPLLGWLADHYGLRSAFYLLAALPLLALLQSFSLPVPELDRDKA